jgi:hypothetical protein
MTDGTEWHQRIPEYWIAPTAKVTWSREAVREATSLPLTIKPA